MTIAILGAGWLGSALAGALPRPVLATTRDGRRPAALPDDVDVLALDVGRIPPLPEPLARARAWVVAIAPGRDQDRRALYVDGARAIVDALPSALERIVWISSTSALPDVDGELDEACDAWPDEPRGRVQREAETIVLAGCARVHVPAFVLRMGGLYGPGRELERVYSSTREPTEPMAGDGMTATNLVHRDDAIASIVAALSAPPDAAGITHVVDDDHGSRRAMFEAVAARLGRAPPQWAEPPGPTVRGKRVANGRMKARLGVRLRHPDHGAAGPPPVDPGSARPAR